MIASAGCSSDTSSPNWTAGESVQYEQPLYEALTEALERRPGASFEVIAVTPEAGASPRSRRNADRVVDSMLGMGLPVSRLRRSSTAGGDGAGEVRIYVR